MTQRATLTEAETLSLEIPSDATYLLTARLFAAAAIRRLGTDENTIEDVKLAVSDSCTGAIKGQADQTGATIRISIRSTDASIAFEIASQGRMLLPGDEESEVSSDSPPSRPGEEAETVGLALIQGLFEDARIESTSSGGTVMTFSFPREPVEHEGG